MRAYSQLPVGINHADLTAVWVLEAVDSVLGKKEHGHLAFILSVAERRELDDFRELNLDIKLIKELDRSSVDGVLRKDEHSTEVTLGVHGLEVNGGVGLQEQVEFAALVALRTHVGDESGLGNHCICIRGKELRRDDVGVGVHI